jgi:hypothetical protein
MIDMGLQIDRGSWFVEQRYRRSLELRLLKGTSRCAQLDNFINATQRLPPGIRLLIRSLASLALGGVKALTSHLVSTILNTAVGNLLPPRIRALNS